MIQKRFPANVTMREATFLNNKKIDGELYAYLQAKTIAEDGVTVLYKKDLPPQYVICQQLGIKDARTYKAHLKYLLDYNYVIDDGDRFIFPNQEDVYLLLPLETLRLLCDTLTPMVIKIYIYLGQRWKYKKGYEFTYGELAEHVGMKLIGNARGYVQINNVLLVLEKLGLIEVSEPKYIGNNMQIRSLVKWCNSL